MNQHLNHEQICDLLLSDSLLGDTNSPIAADASQEEHLEHLQGCLICASELDLLRRSVTGFRATSVAIADRALSRRPLQASLSSLDSKRAARFVSPAFFWAATALLFTAVIPLGLFHENLNPFLKHHDAPIAAATTASVPAQTIESDEALLDGINQDLSASVPSPMQPLDGTTASSASAQTTSPQRND